MGLRRGLLVTALATSVSAYSSSNKLTLQLERDAVEIENEKNRPVSKVIKLLKDMAENLDKERREDERAEEAPSLP